MIWRGPGWYSRITTICISNTWSHRPQGPLAKEILDLRGPWLQSARVGLDVGLLVGGPRGLGAVVQEAVRRHHLRVTLLAAAHAALPKIHYSLRGLADWDLFLTEPCITPRLCIFTAGLSCTVSSRGTGLYYWYHLYFTITPYSMQHDWCKACAVARVTLRGAVVGNHGYWYGFVWGVTLVCWQ